MRYDSGQFGAFDGLDNRKEVMILLQKLGDGLTDKEGDARRANFLKALIRYSGNGFADKMVKIDPCDTVTAYWMFVHITGVLGVPIDKGAKLLDDTVKNAGRTAIRCS